jgi:hypothetical protein
MGGRIQGLCFAQTKRFSERTRVTDKVTSETTLPLSKKKKMIK